MTDKILRNKSDDVFNDDNFDENNKEYLQLEDKIFSMREQMTIDELLELRQYVSVREFHEAVMPLIKTKREQAARRSVSSETVAATATG